jgi:5-methylcytosine-specific restriction endonuclease McrA
MIEMVACRRCGSTFEYERRRRSRVFCSPICSKRWYVESGAARAYQQKQAALRAVAGITYKDFVKPKARTCKWCGCNYQSFQASSVYCSKECNRAGQSAREAPNKKSAEHHAANRRQRWYRRRARKLASPVVESVDPVAICERDGWLCWICGEPAPRELRGTLDKMAPEADHVVPLALGGHHTASNMACAHKGCNMKKGAKLLPLEPPIRRAA